ncbi:unnamed protein product [Ixodes pacificus]
MTVGRLPNDATISNGHLDVHDSGGTHRRNGGDRGPVGAESSPSAESVQEARHPWAQARSFEWQLGAAQGRQN